ncbi:MAG: hypothetical protein ACXADY_13585 [Candidatus Hodarchaeales archaeon]
MKKTVLCGIIGLIFLFNTINISGFQPDANINSVLQEDTEEGVAWTNVNVTLSGTETIYERNTGIDNVEMGADIKRYSAIAKLTTHADLFFEITAEFSGSNDTEWNGNYTQFKNSEDVQFFKNFKVLQEIVPVDISLLENITSSFGTWEEPSHPEYGKIFGVEQRVVLRQTTVFLLSLPEPFQFDLNKLELSQLSDFHFQSEFFHDEETNQSFAFESVRIKAPGSVLEYIPNVKGYTGIIYLTPWEPEEVPRYQRQFADVPQDIMLQIKLPNEQKISFSFDSKYTDNPMTTKRRNIAIFEFSNDGKLPYYIKISSQTPFLEQFSVTDYIGIVFGGLAAIVTSFKGIPYFLNRRSFNKYKRGLHTAAERGDGAEFKMLQEKALNRYMSGKLTAIQFEEVRQEVQLLRKYSRATKETKSPTLEELLKD